MVGIKNVPVGTILRSQLIKGYQCFGSGGYCASMRIISGTKPITFNHFCEGDDFIVQEFADVLFKAPCRVQFIEYDTINIPRRVYNNVIIVVE